MTKKVTENIILENLDKNENVVCVTQTKTTFSNSSEEKLERDACINRFAWSLLIVGLFMLCTAVLGTIVAWSTLSTTKNTPDDNKLNNSDQGNIDISLVIKDRLMSSPAGFDEVEGAACTVVNCDMICNQIGVLYWSIFKASKNFTCDTVQELIVTNLVHNNNADIEYLEMISLKVLSVKFVSVRIDNSDDIFDSIFFSKTYSLIIENCEIEHANEHFLVGLESLRSLKIYGSFPVIDETFFKTIPNRLFNIAINTNLKLDANKNFFGTLGMPKLKNLNLNSNRVEGPLTKTLLEGVNNIKYLHLKYCHIKAVALDFFDNFNQLIYIDLSHNELTTIPPSSYNVHYSNVIINLNYNEWICNCQLCTLLVNYFTDKNRFIDGPFCANPTHLQGLSVYELASACNESISSIGVNTTKRFRDTSIVSTSSRKFVNGDDLSLVQEPIQIPVFKEETSTIRSSRLEGNYSFPQADYHFALELQENNSVKIIVENYEGTPLHVMWFATLDEPAAMYHETIEYECTQYVPPYTITCILCEDTTYTFCLIPYKKSVITPLNCLPFFVPAKTAIDDDIWISQDYKNFTLVVTVAMLFFSAFIGAGISYWGIKAYPHMLVGSKGVLLVKPDEKNRISTVSDFVGRQTTATSSHATPRHSFETCTNNKKTSAGSIECRNSGSLCAFCTGDDYEVPICRCHSNVADITTPPPLPQRNSNPNSNGL